MVAVQVCKHYSNNPFLPHIHDKEEREKFGKDHPMFYAQMSIDLGDRRFVLMVNPGEANTFFIRSHPIDSNGIPSGKIMKNKVWNNRWDEWDDKVLIFKVRKDAEIRLKMLHAEWYGNENCLLT